MVFPDCLAKSTEPSHRHACRGQGSRGHLGPVLENCGELTNSNWRFHGLGQLKHSPVAMVWINVFDGKVICKWVWTRDLSNNVGFNEEIIIHSRSHGNAWHCHADWITKSCGFCLNETCWFCPKCGVHQQKVCHQKTWQRTSHWKLSAYEPAMEDHWRFGHENNPQRWLDEFDLGWGINGEIF